MKKNLNSQLGGVVSLAIFGGSLIASTSVFGLGFLLPDQDAFATARGNAFVATADDPAAVFYNPAGITQLEGSHFSVGAYGIDYGSSYHGRAGTINSKQELGILPQVFSTYQLPYNFTFGLGTYSPYGLRYEWPSSAPFTGQGQTGEIEYVTLNPVLAYKILPTLSVAVGPTLSYSEADFKETFPGFVNHFRGRDDAAGFSAGVMWHPLEQHSFGATYRSAQDMNYNGHATSLTGPGSIQAQANIHFPQVVDVGYSFRPTEKWNFEADAEWMDYSDLRNVIVDPQGQYGDKLSFNWHPSWILSGGATRYFGNGWKVSGGYMFSENSVPQADFNALVPDSNRHIFSIGLGKKYNKFTWDVAYQLLWGPSRSIGLDNYPPTDGTYAFFGHAVSINFGYRF